MARRLAGPETALVLGYLDGADRAEALGRDLTACSHSVHFVTGNLSEPATIAHLRDLVDALGGRCHALVHAVAVANFRPLSEIRGNQWKLVHEVSAWSFVGAVIGVTDALVRAGGAVVALSSHGSTRFVPGYGALGPAKAALESSVRQLACELAGRGVRINAVRAGMIESPNADRFPPEVRDAAVRRTLSDGSASRKRSRPPWTTCSPPTRPGSPDRCSTWTEGSRSHEGLFPTAEGRFHDKSDRASGRGHRAPARGRMHQHARGRTGRPGFRTGLRAEARGRPPAQGIYDHRRAVPPDTGGRARFHGPDTLDIAAAAEEVATFGAPGAELSKATWRAVPRTASRPWTSSIPRR